MQDGGDHASAEELEQSPVTMRAKDDDRSAEQFGLVEDLLDGKGCGDKRLDGEAFVPEGCCELFEAFFDQVEIGWLDRHGRGDHIHGRPDRHVGGDRLPNVQQDKLCLHGLGKQGSSIDDFLRDLAKVNCG